MNGRMLKAKCIEKGLSITDLAIKIDLAPSTFYKKLENGSFTIKEVNAIVEVLDLSCSEILSIFFENNVA